MLYNVIYYYFFTHVLPRINKSNLILSYDVQEEENEDESEVPSSENSSPAQAHHHGNQKHNSSPNTNINNKGKKDWHKTCK